MKAKELREDELYLEQTVALYLGLGRKELYLFQHFDEIEYFAEALAK